jgi:hypothetical protein
MRVLIVLVLCFTAGCSWFWPGIVRSSPDEPLFDSSFPLVGGASTDSALCGARLAAPPAVVERRR